MNSLLDRGLEHDREADAECSQLSRVLGVPRAGGGDAEPVGQLVGEALIPRDVHGRPGRRRHAKDLFELLALAREGSDHLVAGRIDHPAVEPEPAADVEHRPHDRRAVSKLGHPQCLRGVPRVLRDRRLVVDDDHGDPVTAEAADDAEPLVVTADHDRTDLAVPGQRLNHQARSRPALSRIAPFPFHQQAHRSPSHRSFAEALNVSEPATT